jgi:hypothetical protein
MCPPFEPGSAVAETFLTSRRFSDRDAAWRDGSPPQKRAVTRGGGSPGALRREKRRKGVQLKDR